MAGGDRWRATRRITWSLDRPRLLAIINTTPDSFSDGGLIASPKQAAEAAAAAIAGGAGGVDVGGESTRPGAEPVPAHEQIARTTPAIRAIRARIGEGPVITIDTTRASVALAALEAGADAVNDVSAGMGDPAMLALVAARRCGIILMHRRSAPRADVYSHEHRSSPRYDGAGGVVQAVSEFLRERAAAAEHAGIEHDSIVLDPGLGFGKSVAQNLELIDATPRLRELGYPILSGLSRKSFVARNAGMDMDLPPRDRARASVALSLVHWRAGASIFRVHDVREHAAAFRS